MFHKLLGKNYERKYWLRKSDSLVMKNFLNQSFINRRTLICETDIISLDIETTGLNPEVDRIVSIGLVEISNLGIKLNSCWHKIIKTNIAHPENSVVIHNITDDQSDEGLTIEVAIEELLKRLKGKVVLVHNAKIEQGFINKICQYLYNTDFIMRTIDTQVLAKRSFDRKNKSYKPTELRLFNLRKMYKMPPYKAHNALLDALATAELFLAMVNTISSADRGRLNDFLS
ncbi:MAG: exonuclease domain-containing protein [Woeseiaceae bacterium]